MSVTRERPLRVALNLLFLGEQAGGIGRYARALPAALLEAEPHTEITTIVSRAAPADLFEEPWAREVKWLRLPVANRGARLVIAEHVLSPLALARRAEVLHSPANSGPVITPGMASVVSLMDVIWLVRPHEWDEDPAARSATLRQVRHSVRFADRVFAPSAAAASEIAERLAVDPEKLSLTPLGVSGPPAQAHDSSTIRSRLELGSSRIVLCVAQKRRYKNLDALIAALPELPADIALVLVGAPTPYEHELRRQAELLGVDGRVRFPAWVSDQELESLYGAASVFVLPSLIEGFGLPVLEAMARGVPVACSNRPALPEVAGDAGLLFDPESPDELTAAIRRVLEDDSLARQLAEKGRVRASKFSWRRTGEATLAGYRAALASRRR